VREIREVVNSPSWNHPVLAQTREWNKLCAAFDVLEDTELALDHYLQAWPEANVGGQYLFIYGALQAMVVQQDAVALLHQSLGLEYQRNETLAEIRDARNKAIGHPVDKLDKRVGGDRLACFISRSTIERDGFELMQLAPSDEVSFETIALHSMIQQQRSLLALPLAALPGLITKPPT
jgi:hypothetical protein